MTTLQGLWRAAVLAALAMAGSGCLAAKQYNFTVLNSLGGNGSAGYSVNASGTVVGEALLPPDDQDPPMEASRAVRWTGSNPTDLRVLDEGPYAFAYGINDAGQVVGTSFLPGGGGVRATLWAQGTMTNLGTLGGTSSQANAISKAGVIVGSSTTPGNLGTRAFIYKNGTMKALKGPPGGLYESANAIASNGLIAGSSRTAKGKGYVVLWDNGSATRLGRGSAHGVNRSGVVVGTAMADTGFVHAMQWIGTTVTDLGTFGGDQSHAYAINDRGDIVGRSSVDGCCDYRATLWRNGKAIDLNTLVDPSVRDAGWVLTNALGIDGAGHIVGAARNVIEGISRGFLLTP